MSDIVERLREADNAAVNKGWYCDLVREAADEIGRLSEEARWQSFRIADKDCLIESLRAEKAELVEALKRRLSDQLNDHLCGMKEGYDDSIVGFNEAWDVMRKFFDDEAALAKGGGSDMKRHRWHDTERTYGSVRATCQDCGLIRDARFDRNYHWQEFRWPGGEWFATDKTPPCGTARAALAKAEERE